MAKVDEQELAVARVYAGAMLQLAHARGEADGLLNELLDLAGRVEKDAELERFLSSPLIDVDARRATIEKLFRGRRSDLFVDSLQVLNRKDRLGIIRGVAHEYRLAHEELHGRVEVFVRTAAPLSHKLRAKLKEVASRRAGKEADLVETIDESLIGGLVMRIGDEKLDASIATRLRKLAGVLLDRASREIHGGRTYLEGTAD